MFELHEASVESTVTIRSIGVVDVRVVQPEDGLRRVNNVAPAEFLNFTSRYARSFAQEFLATVAVAVNPVVLAMSETFTCWLITVAL
jgi:hypothetical protein